MRLPFAIVLLTLLQALPALAVDVGKAEGSLTVDKARIKLNYAYAVGHQKNELSNRRDDTRIILTDKPLPEGIKLDDVDYSFPEGILGVVVCVTHDDKVGHVVVQHPSGTYDAGYFENDVYHFKPKKGERGTVSGNLSSPRVPTNTMTFWFDIEFSALER